jgi:ComF family protein
MKILSQLLDIIYPPRCPLCSRFLSTIENRRVPHRICEICLQALMPIAHPLCTICGIPFSTPIGTDHLCENCLRKKPWYDFVRAPYLYSGPLMNAIQRFKYNSETHLSSSLGTLLSSFARDCIPNPEDFVIFPVPLHRQRLRERGFNQSLLLAKVLASHLGTQLDYLSLIRRKYTRSQTGLGKEERRKNVANAFAITTTKILMDKNILLIDDVITTGHTLNECSRILKKSGALKVICLALARTQGD